MNTSSFESLEQSQAWVDELRPLPVQEIGARIVARAQEWVETEDWEHTKQAVGKRLTLILDDEARVKYVEARKEAQFDQELDWLLNEANPEDLASEEPEMDKVEETELQAWRNEIEVDRLSRTIRKIDRKLSEAEFAMQFDEDLEGVHWNTGDTIWTIGEIQELQKEVGMPVGNDRLLSCAVQALKRRYSGDLLRSACSIAKQEDNYAAFLEIAAEYTTTIGNERSAEAGEQSMLEAATYFIQRAPSVPDEQLMGVTLTALARYGRRSESGIYPIVIARLGRALKETAVA